MVQIAEEKQHRDIIQLLTELMHTDTEVDITQKDDVSINPLNDRV